MIALAEWVEAYEIPVTLLDLDTENKARGSLKHFFSGVARGPSGKAFLAESAH
jgi:hypothetical protein